MEESSGTVSHGGGDDGIVQCTPPPLADRREGSC